MRTPLLVLAAVLLFLVVFWAGLVRHFPGEALGRYLEARLSTDPRVQVELEPVRLGWTGVRVQRARVRGRVRGEAVPVVAFHDLEIPLSFSLLQGLSLYGALGRSGSLEVYWPWRGGPLQLEGRGVRLEDVPALALVRPARVRGSLSLSGTLDPAAARSGGLPEGRLRGTAQGVQVGRAEIMGQSLPTTRLEEVRFRVGLGEVIELRELNLRGDVQGTVTGTLRPRLSAPRRSPIDLEVALAMRPGWVQQFGSFAPIVESFLRGGRLEATLGGTLARPTMRRARGSS